MRWVQHNSSRDKESSKKIELEFIEEINIQHYANLHHDFRRVLNCVSKLNLQKNWPKPNQTGACSALSLEGMHGLTAEDVNKCQDLDCLSTIVQEGKSIIPFRHIFVFNFFSNQLWNKI